MGQMFCINMGTNPQVGILFIEVVKVSNHKRL